MFDASWTRLIVHFVAQEDESAVVVELVVRTTGFFSLPFYENLASILHRCLRAFPSPPKLVAWSAFAGNNHKQHVDNMIQCTSQR